jgi:hypothetical protein
VTRAGQDAAATVALADTVLLGQPGDAALALRRLLPTLYRLRARVQLAIDALEREARP